MKRIVRLTESDLTRIVRRVISEQAQTSVRAGSVYFKNIMYDESKNHITFTPTNDKNFKYTYKCYGSAQSRMSKLPLSGEGARIAIMTPNYPGGATEADTQLKMLCNSKGVI